MKYKKIIFLLFLFLLNSAGYSKINPEWEQLLIRAKFYESNNLFFKAEQIYLQIEKLYPVQTNFLEIANFYARQKNNRRAVYYIYRSLKDIDSDYQYMEDFFIRYFLYDDLLKFYFKGEWGTKSQTLKEYFRIRIVETYKILSQYENSVKYLIKIIQTTNQIDQKYFNMLYEIALQEEKSNLVISELKNLNDQKLPPITHFKIEKFLGKLYYMNNRYKMSRIHYQKAIRSGYYNYSNVIEIFNVFYSDGLYSHCLKLLNTYLKLLKVSGKKNNLIYFKSLEYKAELYLVMKKTMEAENLFKQIISTGLKGQGFTNKAYFNMGKIYFSKGDYKSSKQYFSQVGKPLELAESNHQSVEHLSIVYIIRCFLAEEDYEGAKIKIDNTIKRYSENQYLLYYSAILLLYQSQYMECINYFEKIITHFGHSDIAIYTLEKLEVLYQIKNNINKLKLFTFFEKLLDAQKYNLLIANYNKIINYNGLSEDQKNYYLIHFSNIFILKEKFIEAENVLLTINNNSKNKFWRQKSLFLLGKLYLESFDKKSKGIQILKKFIKKYPDSLFRSIANDLIKKYHTNKTPKNI